jgi:hypothetical protein
MSTAEFELRLERLEQEVKALKEQSINGWWRRIVGTFANDRAHEEAMRIAREFRKKHDDP